MLIYINIFFFNIKSFFIQCIDNNLINIIIFLIKNGFIYKNIIHYCIKKRKFEIFKIIVEQLSKKNLKKNYFINAVFLAVNNNLYEYLDVFIQNRFDLTFTYDDILFFFFKLIKFY